MANDDASGADRPSAAGPAPDPARPAGQPADAGPPRGYIAQTGFAPSTQIRHLDQAPERPRAAERKG